MTEGNLELRFALERRPRCGISGLVGGWPEREVALVVVVRVRGEDGHFFGLGAGVADPSVSRTLAVRLEQAGVGTARAWLAMQSVHDLAAEPAAGTLKVGRRGT